MKRRTWAEYTWPEWVPQKVRDDIQSFWDDGSRGPDAWLKAADEPYNRRDGVEFGEVVTLHETGGPGVVTGRYIYAWGNLARLIDDRGTVWHATNGRVPFCMCWDEMSASEESALKIYEEDPSEAAVVYAERVYSGSDPFDALDVIVITPKKERKKIRVCVEFDPTFSVESEVDIVEGATP